jgi:hypothetical protein
VAEPKNPALPKLREWPMFRGPAGKRRKAAHDGRAPPRISELIMEHVPGAPAEKLAWLRQQAAEGHLDGDDADEIAEAEALLVMLARISDGRAAKKRRHLDEVLDEGLKKKLPASDPVSVGRFTVTEALNRPAGDTVTSATTMARSKGRRAPRELGR